MFLPAHLTYFHMKTLQFQLNPPKHWLTSLSDFFGFSFSTDSTEMGFDNEVGAGNIKAFEFQQGFWMVSYDFILKDDLLVKRLSEPRNEFFLLTYYLEETSLDLDDTLPLYHQRTHKVYFQSASLEGLFHFQKNTRFKILMIAFSRYWLEEKLTLNAEMKRSVFADLLYQNKPLLVTETLRAESKRLLQEIQEPIAPSYLQPLIAESQTLELVTRFFAKIEQNSIYELNTSLNVADVQKILRIKDHLLSDLHQRPLIAALAREAAMSESKLKRLFQQLVGESIYAFYQKHRLERAKVMLQEGSHSISTIGYEIGYSNLSHFANAFRKQYGYLPKEFSTILQD